MTLKILEKKLDARRKNDVDVYKANCLARKTAARRRDSFRSDSSSHSHTYQTLQVLMF